jgi:ribose 5-phosphate isomerase A
LRLRKAYEQGIVKPQAAVGEWHAICVSREGMESVATPDALAGVALSMIRDGFVVGLGSGRAAAAFVRALGRRVAEGLRIRGVPTSQATANLAAGLGIPLVSLDGVDSIDVTVDGADEVDPQLNLIKGLGGALVREKIVAAVSRRRVILVHGAKLVSTLGDHGVLPVEVVPFGLPFCRRQLGRLGYPAVPRQAGEQLFISDNGNPILDCRVSPLPDPAKTEQAIRAIPGVVGTGLFLNIADTVVIHTGREIEIRHRGNL